MNEEEEEVEMILTRREEQETSAMTEIEEYIGKNNKIKEKNWDITGVNETKLNKQKGKFEFKEWNEMKTLNNSTDEEKSKGSQLSI
ncbi:hypothetical protein RhiirA4_549458, partial [Rhizophagus irregularis]